jgi:16S rRNA (guanine966-N2)-methyltransferase
MTRIIAGAAGGRRLAAPPGRHTRPTSDRAREGLFATLASIVGPLTGTRFLDLYAGSGAVGLEALSRGAAHALLVESDPRSAATARANAQLLALDAEVRAVAVERLAAGPPPVRADDPAYGPAYDPAYDIAFLDPPYDLSADTVRAVLRGLVKHGWLTSGAVVVVERASRAGDFQWPEGFYPERARRYGEGTLWYGRAQGG